MRLPSCYHLLTLVLSSALCGDVLGAQGPVGIFTTHSAVGRGRGSASYDPRRQTYLIAGSGQNMWDVRDDFHFVWKRISGNFILSTRARFICAGVEEHRKIGWTIRPSLEPNSAHVTAALHGNGLMSLQFRRQTGGVTEEVKSPDSLPDADAVIQLGRRDWERGRRAPVLGIVSGAQLDARRQGAHLRPGGTAVPLRPRVPHGRGDQHGIRDAQQ